MCFQSDLAFGKFYEHELGRLVERNHPEAPSAVYNESKTRQGLKQWDVRHNGHVYEVKSDRLTVQSGNIAVEYLCNGQESGITTTKADRWIHFVVGRPYVLVIRTEKLRKILNNSTFRSVPGGDGKRARMYLVPVWDVERNQLLVNGVLYKYFKRVKHRDHYNKTNEHSGVDECGGGGARVSNRQTRTTKSEVVRDRAEVVCRVPSRRTRSDEGEGVSTMCV